MEHYQLLGTKITSATVMELSDLILRTARENRRIHIASGNIHSLNLCNDRPLMRSFLNSAAAVRCDGYGVVLAARLCGIRLAQRITWADWWGVLNPFCEKHGLSMFFLGSKPGVAEAAREAAVRRHPRLHVAVHHGFFEKSGKESEAVVSLVNSAKPDVLIVGMGMPVQEAWLTRYRKLLEVPVVMTGGACLDYLSGKASRCPTWMSEHGLEWFYRLLMEPRQKFRRYVIGNPLFFLRLFMRTLSGKRAMAITSSGPREFSDSSRSRQP